MARSVAELLPRPFGELTLQDVEAIVQTVGEERETLFFERKAAINGNTLAKACAAFANTYGGLLLVGVADDDDTLTGIDPLAAEAQLWVKDTLRGLVLPLPPFRTRWLPTSSGRGLLLVLVEESGSTPHLLTRSGAIYVRNPGSSDPVPLADQRRLLELAARGERAQGAAIEAARAAANVRIETKVRVTEALALAATGVTASFEERLFAPTTPEFLSTTTWGERRNPNEGRWTAWGQHHVGVHRIIRRDMFPIHPDVGGAVSVTRTGAATIYRGDVSPRDALGEEREDAMTESQLRVNFDDAMRAAREALVELGAHGDLRLAYSLMPGSRQIYFDSIPGTSFRDAPNVVVELWTTPEDASVGDRVFAEVARAAGVGPPGLE